jgi:hypothetical protein
MKSFRHRFVQVTVWFIFSVICAGITLGQVNLGNPTVGDRSVQAVLVSDLFGENGLTQLTLRPGDSDSLYFTDRSSNIWHIDLTSADTVGNFTKIVTLDDSSLIHNRVSGPNSGNGMRGLAFHPDFANVGAAGAAKLYTVHEEAFGSGTPTFAAPHSPDSTAQDSVLTEWVWDFSNNSVDLNSARQVLRVQMTEGHHPMQQIVFNPAAEPNDSDYGKLYVPIGDGGTNPSSNTSIDPFGESQDPSNVIGSILRIDPLDPDGAGSAAYSIPSGLGGNALANDNDASTLGEIFSYGFRHPQTLGFDRMDGRLFVGDIGQNSVEEIDLLINGGNFGYAKREGTVRINSGSGAQDTEIPLETRLLDSSTYPVTQFDHINNNGGGANAIVGGYVYDGELATELERLYLFGNLSSDEVYYAFANDLLNDEDPAEIFRLQFNDENNLPIDFGDAVGSARTLMRFGQDAQGEIYIFSQDNGKIFRLEGTPTNPSTPGDFDGDSDVDGFDFLKWQRGESPIVLSAGDLADWESHYGVDAGSWASTSDVPEPATASIFFLAVSLLLMFGCQSAHRDTC